MSILNMVARLRAAYASVDAITVEATVREAYESFHHAKVRTYIPILVERQARKILNAAYRTAPGHAVDGEPTCQEPDAATPRRPGEP